MVFAMKNWINQELLVMFIKEILYSYEHNNNLLCLNKIGERMEVILSRTNLSKSVLG